MSNDQSVPVRKVIPYKSGRRPDTTRRLNLDFAGTALEQALADRDALTRVPDSTHIHLAEPSEFDQTIDAEAINRLSESRSLSASLSRPESASDSPSLSNSVSAPQPLSDSHSESLSVPLTQSISTRPSVSPSESRSLSRSLSVEPQTGNTVLDATHSGAEQRVYSQMYRETISKGKQDGYFPIPELKRLTGIRSTNTIRRATQGLIEKLSIKLLEKNQGSHYGSHYRIFGPKEIMTNRKKAGIVIDQRTKRIVSLSGSPSLSDSLSPAESWPVSASMSAAGIDNDDSQNMTVNDAHVYINNNNPNGFEQSSSGPVERRTDDEKLARTRNWFEQLSGGGNWKAERDEPAYAEIAHCNQWHILLGLCYSVSRSPEHKMSSLKYAVPAILNHYRDMAEFPESVLAEIGYKTKIKTLNCLATGNWTIPDWEK